MIFVYDGSAPLLMIALMIIYFFIYKKEKKEGKILQNKFEISKNNADEFDRLVDLIHNGKKNIKKDDFKYLNENDFTHFKGRGVKFI